MPNPICIPNPIWPPLNSSSKTTTKPPFGSLNLVRNPQSPSPLAKPILIATYAHHLQIAFNSNPLAHTIVIPWTWSGLSCPCPWPHRVSHLFSAHVYKCMLGRALSRWIRSQSQWEQFTRIYDTQSRWKRGDLHPSSVTTHKCRAIGVYIFIYSCTFILLSLFRTPQNGNFFPPNFLSGRFSPMTDSLINNNNIVPENCILLSFMPAYHRPLFRKSSRPRRLFVSSKLRTLRSSFMRDALSATLKIATLYNHPSNDGGIPKLSSCFFLLLLLLVLLSI